MNDTWNWKIKKLYPHWVILKPGRGDHEAVIDWVEETFTVGTYTWVGLTFFFKNEHDSVFFALRWA